MATDAIRLAIGAALLASVLACAGCTAMPASQPPPPPAIGGGGGNGGGSDSGGGGGMM